MTAQLAFGQLVTTTWLNEVERRYPRGASVATEQTTISTTYADLATVGPAVTVTTGTSALVIISSFINNDTVNTLTFAGVAVSGATTRAADDTSAMQNEVSAGFQGARVSVIHLFTGLTAGSNTFTMKYRVGGGTGRYRNRHLVVIPQD